MHWSKEDIAEGCREIFISDKRFLMQAIYHPWFREKVAGKK